MNKILIATLLFLSACGIYVPPPPPARVVAIASITNYVYGGLGYSYYNDCGPVYYYSDGTYDATCTYSLDGIMRDEIVYVGNTLSCPGPSYSLRYSINGGWDLMDYTVNCQ